VRRSHVRGGLTSYKLPQLGVDDAAGCMVHSGYVLSGPQTMDHHRITPARAPEECWIDPARLPPAALSRRPVDSWQIIPGALDEHDITIATFVRTVRDVTGLIAVGSSNRNTSTGMSSTRPPPACST
jgi:hypothetical protein